MKQIRLNEMDNARKIQHAEPKRKKGLKKSGLLMYILPLIVVAGWVVYLCVTEYEDVQFIIMVPVLIITIFMIITGNKIRGEVLDYYDVITQERVWEGYMDEFKLHQNIEFVDRNGQILVKKFTDENYKKFEGKENIHVIFIPKQDVWYMESEK